MKKYLLPEKCNFYKANLHCHSTWSDGKHSPEELKQLYKEQGYSVLSITDHDGFFGHYDLDDEDFITLAGFELEFDSPFGDDFSNCITTHLCAYAKDRDNLYQPGFDPEFRHEKIFWTKDEKTKSLIKPLGKPFKRSHETENVNYVIRTLHENGFIVTYNHPTRSLENYSVYMNYSEIDNLEIYNNACYTDGYDEHNGKVYDDMLRAGRRIFCVAADDNHALITKKNHDMFGGFTMFCAERLTHGDIINAFEKGNFYASAGPEINSLYFEDGEIFVKMAAPVEGIRFVTGNRKTEFCFNHDRTPVSEASFKVDPKSRYVRVEIIDGSKRAYTNAYFTDQLPF